MNIELRYFIFRWSHALLFHQSVVDFLRSCILIPLSVSILGCKAIHSCNILETSFLLLVTASTVSLFSESYQLCWVMSWLVLYSYQDTRYKAILVFCMSVAFSPLYRDWRWPCGISTFLFSDAKVPKLALSIAVLNLFCVKILTNLKLDIRWFAIFGDFSQKQ